MVETSVTSVLQGERNFMTSGSEQLVDEECRTRRHVATAPPARLPFRPRPDPIAHVFFDPADGVCREPSMVRELASPFEAPNGRT